MLCYKVMQPGLSWLHRRNSAPVKRIHRSQQAKHRAAETNDDRKKDLGYNTQTPGNSIWSGFLTLLEIKIQAMCICTLAHDTKLRCSHKFSSSNLCA